MEAKEVIDTAKKKSYKAGYDKALAQLAAMTEECKQMGRREVVEWLRKYPRILDELRDVLPDQLKDWGIDNGKK